MLPLFLLYAHAILVSTNDVLVLQPFGSQSHSQMLIPIIKQLDKRGHQVTLVSTYNLKTTRSTNITQITYPQFKNHFTILQDITMDVANYGWSKDIFTRYYNYHSELCEKFYDSRLLQNWISKGKKFSLVIIDAAMHECVLPLWTTVGQSLILLETGPIQPWVRLYLHMHTPYSHIPFVDSPYTHRMTFFQRCLNTIYWVVTNYIFDASHSMFYENVVLPRFPEAKPFPVSLRNISLVLLNADPVMIPPWPTLPTVVRIGGIHCRPPLPLSDGKLKSFVNGSDENGFILVSFGSVINGNLVDKKLRNTLIAAFSQIKQRVVWKYETPLPDLPSNVMITEWLPQQDLLGHPKIRAFINHGGLHSLQEASYHAVPQICLPMTTDQPSSVATVSALGLAIKLDYHTVTVEEVVQAINKVTEDEEMRKRVEYYSKIFHDREEKPLDKAIYWIEYVMHYHGAHHLQTAAANLNFFQYYLLDVGALALVLLFSVVSLVWFGMKRFMIAITNFFTERIKPVIKIKTS